MASPRLHIPGYELGYELGRGAMGRVVAARHEATGAEVAIKLVRPQHDKARLALENEVLAMARLNHPSVLYLYDYGTVGYDRTVWMALEKASGGALEGWQPGSWPEVFRVLESIVAGLAHAHARGMVHRDLKPENLLVATTRDHRPGLKIADFGLTVQRDGARVIRRGGTPLYMPPEQAREDRGELGPWSDVYALGAILWEWVCGQAPFEGEVEALMEQHCDAPLPAFEPRFHVPTPLSRLLARMLAKDPQERPSSAAELMRVLRGRGRRTVARAMQEADSGAASARLPGIGASLLSLRQWRVVGRTAEKAALVEALSEVRADSEPALLVLWGPRDVGKTCLARWIAETAEEAGLARAVWDPDDVGHALELAERGPVVVVFDELDRRAEELMPALAFSGRPVLVVATTRRSELKGAVASLPGLRPLRVRPMAPAPFRDLLETELGCSGRVAVRMDRLCDYLPGRAVGWLRELAQEGALRPSPEGFEVDDARLRRSPDHPEGSLPELIGALARLRPDEVHALRLAALLGLTVDGGAWLRLLESRGLDVPHEALLRLARAGLIERLETGFAWVSPHVREAVAQPEASPQEHRDLARVLAALPETPERRHRRGVHLLLGGQHAEGRRVLLTRAAALSPPLQELLRETVEVVREHMDGATPTERVVFQLMELRVLLNLVSGPAAIPAADALLEVLGTPARPGPLYREVPVDLALEALEFVARVYAFERLPEKAHPLLDDLPDTAATLRCRGLLAGDAGQSADAEALLRRALALATSDAQRARIANGIGSVVARSGRHDGALGWFGRCLGLLEPEQHYVPLGNMAMSLLALGRYPQALQTARAAFLNAQHRGARRVAVGAITYGVAAVLADEDELPRIADQALFSLKRYGIGDGALLAEVLRQASPKKPATRAFVQSMLQAFEARDP